MKRARRGVPVCKGQIDLWGELVDLARYKRERVSTERIAELLGFLYRLYGTWGAVESVTGIEAHLLRSWHARKVQSIDRDHALHIVETVIAHRKPKDSMAFDHDVKRRLPSREETEIAHREEQRAWRAYYRARSRGENPVPPGEKDTSRTRSGRKREAG